MKRNKKIGMKLIKKCWIQDGAILKNYPPPPPFSFFAKQNHDPRLTDGKFSLESGHPGHLLTSQSCSGNPSRNKWPFSFLVMSERMWSCFFLTSQKYMKSGNAIHITTVPNFLRVLIFSVSEYIVPGCGGLCCCLFVWFTRRKVCNNVNNSLQLHSPPAFILSVTQPVFNIDSTMAR